MDFASDRIVTCAQRRRSASFYSEIIWRDSIAFVSPSTGSISCNLFSSCTFENEHYKLRYLLARKILLILCRRIYTHVRASVTRKSVHYNLLRGICVNSSFSWVQRKISTEIKIVYSGLLDNIRCIGASLAC